MTGRKQILSWALYDWANSAFATTIMAGFFPIFFKQYWCAGMGGHQSTFLLGAANSTASIVVALMAPTLGSIADTASAKKRFLMFFAYLGAVATGSLWFVDKGHHLLAAAFYILAAIGFYGGNIFYDSLLVTVVPRNKTDFASALGYSLGYLGGGCLFAFNVAMALNPAVFGIESGTRAVQVSFLTVALWWAVFALPLFIWVHERRTREGPRGWAAVGAGLRQLSATFREIRKHRTVFLFLLAYWFYIDGVDTIILMAVDYGMSLGFDSTALIKALLITQFVGFPAALAFGKMGERLGTKRSIFVGITVYIAVALWGFFMRNQVEFYGLAIAIGLVQGGVQSLSRSFYARLIPESQAAEFFGFYNMLGKFAAIIGPTLMGWVALLTREPRYSVFAIIFLFLAGASLLYWVREPQNS